MQTYAQYQPTGFDAKGLGLEDRQDWLVLPLIQTRDSGPLERSNFAVATGQLVTVDPDGETFETHRFGHWGPGWYEILLVAPNSRAAEVAEEIAASLENYPALNENHWSDLEWSEACESWERSSLRDRVELLQRAGQSIFAARRAEFPADPQGAILQRLSGC